MVDISIQKSLSENVIRVYELLAEQHPEHRDYFLSAPEYLFHIQRLQNLAEIAASSRVGNI